MKDKNKFNLLTRLVLCGLLAMTLLTLINNCTRAPAPRQEVPSLVWPPPPQPARIQLVDIIASAEDIGAVRKKNLKDWLVGEDPRRSIIRLRTPHGLCTDSRGRLYVADTQLGVVVVFDRWRHKMYLIGLSQPGQLAGPVGVTVDASDRVYVSDPKLKAVYIYSSDYKFIGALGKKGDFLNPVGLAVDKKRNRLLVVDSKAHQVKVFSLDGRPITQFGERGPNEGQFNFPTHIAIGKDGLIYVVDTINFRVQVFDENYQYFDDFGVAGDRPGQFARPKGIALDSDNHIYVVDAAFNNFQIFDQDYRVLLAVGEGGDGPGQFWLPAGIHIDDQDFIYVSDAYNRRVQIFRYLK
jgi:DNA-binding beta-propeller fold protein YncE